MDYAWEKLFSAVLGMAASPHSLQERIADAYCFHLIHIRPEQNLPAELQTGLAEIAAAMSTQSAKADEGTAMASALAMSTEQAQDVAGKIVSLYDKVSARRTHT